MTLDFQMMSCQIREAVATASWDTEYIWISSMAISRSFSLFQLFTRDFSGIISAAVTWFVETRCARVLIVHWLPYLYETMPATQPTRIVIRISSIR